MTRSIIILVAVLVLAGLGWYFLAPQDAPQTAATATNPNADVSEATQKAIDFCTANGGTVEQIVAAEGVAYLCATAEGAKVEVGDFMADNAQ